MKFTLKYTTLALAVFASSASAFAPTSANVRAWGVKPLAATEGPLLDTNFDDVDVSRLLGYNTVQKIIKKNASKAKRAERAAAAPASTEAAPASVKSGLKLIISGAPASGKGTQCEIIKEEYGVVHLSTGDMLRAAVAAGTEVGIQAKEAMDAGKLVSDEIIIGVISDRLKEDDCKTNGWLLDGFPRTPAQAEALAAAGLEADCFLFLNVPDEVLVERVVGRRTDPETGKIYHMTFSPPEDEAVLARLEQRSDDTEEKVKVRLEQFHANVDAVKGSYSDISVEIDGTAAPTDVAKAVGLAITSKVA
jgi:adenylate kinase